VATRPLPRVSDSLWVQCCQLWKEISEFDRSVVIKAMEFMAEKRATTNESQDPDASTPEE